MTVTPAPVPTPRRRFHRRLPGGRLLGDGTVLYWWGELVFVIVFYVAYSVARNANGNDPGAAYRNAIQLIGWQKTLGLNHEHACSNSGRCTSSRSSSRATTSTGRCTSS